MDIPKSPGPVALASNAKELVCQTMQEVAPRSGVHLLCRSSEGRGDSRIIGEFKVVTSNIVQLSAVQIQMAL
jgi:hypothetical protein